MTNNLMLSKIDSDFLKYMRSVGMFTVISAHLGLGWAFPPYSYFLFFTAGIFYAASGAVNYFSYMRTGGTIEFFKKRVVSLYLPYALFCIIALIVFIIREKQLPHFDFHSILLWIFIRPSREIAPFPMFQLWFIRTLVWCMIISPIVFKYMYNINKVSVVFLLAVIFLSILELPVEKSFFVSSLGIDTYRIIFYTAFFTAGVIIFNNIDKFTKGKIAIIFCISLFIALTSAFLSEDPVEHIALIESPDLCYAASSMATFMLFLFLKNPIVNLIKKRRIISFIFDVFDKYSLGIFFFHTLPLDISEKYMPVSWDVEYWYVKAIIKICFTISITMLISIPFHILTEHIRKKI